VLTTNSKKLEPRSRVCLFVGYSKETRGGLFYDPKDNKVFVSTNATFLEEDHIRDHKLRSKLILSEIFHNNDSTSTRDVDNSNTSTRVVDGANSSSQNPFQELKESRRSGRVISPSIQYMSLTEAHVIISDDDDIEDPLSFK